MSLRTDGGSPSATSGAMKGSVSLSSESDSTGRPCGHTSSSTRLPSLRWDTVRRWAGAVSWTPAETLPICRHRRAFLGEEGQGLFLELDQQVGNALAGGQADVHGRLATVQAVLDGDEQRVELLHGHARLLQLQQRFTDARAPQHTYQPFWRGQPLAARTVQQAMHGKDGSG